MSLHNRIVSYLAKVLTNRSNLGEGKTMEENSLAKRMKENLTGEKVMLMSNEDEPILVGTIESWECYTLAKQWLPHVKTENGTVILCLGAILPYHKKLKAFLESLPYQERFELYRDMVCLRSDLQYIEKNYSEPEETA